MIKTDYIVKETKEKNEKKIKQRIINFCNIKNLNIFFLFLIVISGIYFLTGVNDLAIKGFKLQELRQNLTDLERENKLSKTKVMTLESFNNLTEKAQKLNMVAMGEIEYIVSLGEIVAKK